jgi:hypothetical protein
MLQPSKLCENVHTGAKTSLRPLSATLTLSIRAWRAPKSLRTLSALNIEHVRSKRKPLCVFSRF